MLRGESGVGKTALLDYQATRSSGCRVMRTVGVQSEMELAFARLHQLCASVLGHLDRLSPSRERSAPRSECLPGRRLIASWRAGPAVGGGRGASADRHHRRRAVARPRLSQALGFVTRRLVAESVALVFAVRVPGDDVAGLPQLMVERLGEGDARTLLASMLTRRRRRLARRHQRFLLAGHQTQALIVTERPLYSIPFVSGLHVDYAEPRPANQMIAWFGQSGHLNRILLRPGPY